MQEADPAGQVPASRAQAPDEIGLPERLGIVGDAVWAPQGGTGALGNGHDEARRAARTSIADSSPDNPVRGAEPAGRPWNPTPVASNDHPAIAHLLVVGHHHGATATPGEPVA